MADIKRQDIDDFGKRNSNKDSYKNRYFDGKRSAIDEYTGERVFYSSKGHYTTKTTANIDHVIPIDQLTKRYGKDVSKAELKSIANSDYNLATTSEALNKAKSNMSNHEYLWKKLKNGDPEDFTTTYNMLHKEASSETAVFARVKTSKISTKVKKLTKNNIDFNPSKSVGKAVNAGTASALIALTISSCNNLAQIAAGEKSIGEAVKDIAFDSGSSFVSSAGVSLMQDGVVNICKEYASKDIAKFVAQDLPIAEITTAVMVGRSVLRCLNGEITEEECATEIILNGAGYFAFKIGMLCGGPAGAVVASLIVSQISATVLKYQQEKKIAAKRMAKFNRIVSDALIALEKQKNILADFREKEREKLAKAFNTGFEYIQLSILQNNVDGITDGLNCILSVFNEKCAFQSLDEFNDFFDNEEAVLVL